MSVQIRRKVPLFGYLGEWWMLMEFTIVNHHVSPLFGEYVMFSLSNKQANYPSKKFPSKLSSDSLFIFGVWYNTYTPEI